MSAATSDRPGPSEHADDGTAVIGADPDMTTDPAETDVEASPEGGTGGDRSGGVGDHGASGEGSDAADDHGASDDSGVARP
ncbi:hypothetical protein AA0Z99_08330 [Agrococcus sp. 1P02AA]|uniref:hypothetical protein n=1 Tax=Agrococcus sp. 1P02AA TaxID=3132259 RepID=UPI0039A6E53A